MTQHPITPPPELIEQWRNQAPPSGIERATWIATQAARWGADQELEACCEWVHETFKEGFAWCSELRDLRRPKPPSLKEQALATLEAIEKLWESCGDNPTDIIRCALEALPDD